MKIKVLLINEEGAQFIDVENTNKGINEALKWDDAWNTPIVSVCGREYMLICSDTGKVRHEKISALCIKNLYNPKDNVQEPFMVGNIIVSKFDGIDDLTTLNKEDCETLNSRIYHHHYIYSKEFNPALLVID